MLKLRDISKLANVSPSAVSLVLHGKPGVGPEKRALIEQLLWENGYSILSTKPLVKRISFLKYISNANAIDSNPGFITAIMDAAELECRNNGYTLSIVTFTDISHIVSFVNSQELDGIILLGTEISEEDMHYFNALKAPCVVVDNLLASIPCHAITMDNYASIFTCVEHLSRLGHSKIGFLRNKSARDCNCEVRMRAFIEALNYYGLPYDPSLVYELDSTLNGSYTLTRNLLQNNVRFPSALVASCDVAALGALKAFEEFGIRVPQDISITGFDDISFTEISNPPLTTVKVPCAAIGIWAVRLICQLAQNPNSPPLKLQLGTTFTVRESTAPYRGHSENPYIL